MGYSKDVYEKAWQEMDRRRENAESTAQRNREEVSQKIPDVQLLHQKMMEIGTRLIKIAVSSSPDLEKSIEKLQTESLALQEDRKEIMTAHGYPPDYLVEQYVCAKCGDTGYVGTKMCSCFLATLEQFALAKLNEFSGHKKSGGISKQTFSSFSLDYYPSTPISPSGVIPRKHMSEVFEFCRQFARNFSLSSNSIIMIGSTGLGKTHLSRAIANEVTAGGFGVLYSPTQQLIDRLETRKFSYDSSDKAEYASQLEMVFGCDLLILDDFGTEFSSAFTTSILYSIINTRLSDGLPTIVNTNLSLTELDKKYSQRLASRLGFEYDVLRFVGGDVRMKKKKKSAN